MALSISGTSGTVPPDQRYERRAVLGSGGHATVYLAHDRERNADVAVKLLHGAWSAHSREQLHREAESLRRVRHANVVEAHELLELDGAPALAMAYVPGNTLKAHLAECTSAGRTFPSDRTLRVLREVAAALDAAHAQGVIHCDVKPSNILLRPSGEAVVVDFGIARVLHATQHRDATWTAAGVGTPRYLAPEQVEGSPVERRTDVYALALVAFELLTGAGPFDRDSEIASALARVRERPRRASELRPDLGREVDRVFARALAQRVDARHATASAFVADLEHALGESSRVSSRMWLLLRLVAAVVIGAVAVTALALQPAADPSHGLAPANSAIQRGPLRYAVPLAGTMDGLRTTHGQVRARANSLEFYSNNATEQEDSGVLVTGMQPVHDYVAELEMAVTPGSAGRMVWHLREAAETYHLHIEGDGRARFVHCRDTTCSDISPTGSVGPLGDGRRVRLEVLVQGPRLALFADGRPVLDVADDRVPTTTRVPRLAYGRRGPGTMTVFTLAFYDVR